MQPPPSLSPETLAAQALGDVDPLAGGLTPAINPSTSYEQPDGSYRQDRVYTRADNPTYETAEGLLAALEGAGCACALFASGMAAATAVFQALLPGDHVLVSRVLYWGVRKWLAEFALTWGLDVEFVDTTDLDALRSAIRPGRTRLLWVETPANPMWELTDLVAVCEAAHAAGVRVAVDNTVATPVHTRPLELGADLVVHSATKYLNGHSDVLAGAVLTARRDPFWERIRSWRRNAGAVLGPFEAWLLQRGMRTLFLRVRRASDSALAIASHLHGHPALQAVLYPGLPSHPPACRSPPRWVRPSARCRRATATWASCSPKPRPTRTSRRHFAPPVGGCASSSSERRNRIARLTWAWVAMSSRAGGWQWTPGRCTSSPPPPTRSPPKHHREATGSLVNPDVIHPQGLREPRRCIGASRP
jgi:cystathionine gamma-synthase